MKIRKLIIGVTGFRVHWVGGASLFIQANGITQSRSFACRYLSDSPF